MNVTVPGVRPATTLVVVLAIITGANLFTEPYLLTGGGGPDGASASPVLVMYQRGIEQGEPDFAAALGVILVVAGARRLAGPAASSWSVTDMAVEALPAELAAADDAPRRAAPDQRPRPQAPPGGAVPRRLRLPVPLLLHAHRLAAGRPGHRGSRGALPNPSNLTLDNYTQINDQLSLGRALFNSGVFTGAVILGTVVFGLLAGYALAVLSFRGKGTVFASLLLVQVVPFQLLTIPLYVLIVRDYGLADSYLGMILPFAINSTAVFVFRQFFLQLPRELFDAARIDGASELTILLRIAIPLSKPALLTAVLLTFIGPWNEFLWPFLVTKEQDMQPLAVSLANYISTVSGRASNPFGAILAGACVLAAPAVALFIVVPAAGSSRATSARASRDDRAPFKLTRLGVVMSPDPDDPLEAEGVLNPASGRTPDGRLHLLPRLVEAGNVSRVGLAEVVLTDGVPTGVERRGVVLAPDAGWERGTGDRGRRGPARHHDPEPRPARDDLRRLRPARPAAGARGLRRPRVLAAARPAALRLRARARHRPQPVPEQGRGVVPGAGAGPGRRPAYAMLHRPMWDLGWLREGEGVHLPAGVTDDRPGIWISYVPVEEAERDLSRADAAARPPAGRDERVRVGEPQDRRRAAAAAGRRGLAADPPRRQRRARPGLGAAARRALRGGRDAARRGRPGARPRPQHRAAALARVRGGALRDGRQRRLPDRDRGGRRPRASSSTGWPTAASASRSSSASDATMSRCREP